MEDSLILMTEILLFNKIRWKYILFTAVWRNYTKVLKLYSMENLLIILDNLNFHKKLWNKLKLQYDFSSIAFEYSKQECMLRLGLDFGEKCTFPINIYIDRINHNINIHNYIIWQLLCFDNTNIPFSCLCAVGGKSKFETDYFKYM